MSEVAKHEHKEVIKYRYTFEEVEAAVLASKGYIKKVARELKKCDGRKPSWHTARRHIEHYGLQELLLSKREEHIDNAEKCIHDAVKHGDTGAAMFVLKTVGKDRGYTDKQIVEHQGGEIIIQIGEHERNL